jgi:hypothetical protein
VEKPEAFFLLEWQQPDWLSTILLFVVGASVETSALISMQQ